MLIAIAVAIILLFFIYGIHQYVLDKRHRLPPGPTPLPFIGNALWFSKTKGNWIVFKELAETYGPVFTFYAGQRRIITLNDVKVIREAIVEQSKVFSDRPITVMPGFSKLPIGVAFASGKLWQERRRFCLKALRDFGMGKIAMVDKIHDEINYCLEEIDRRATSGRPFAPKMLLTNTISNVICSLVFGKRFTYDDSDFVELVEKIQYLVSRPFNRRFAFFAFPFLRFFVTPADFEVGRTVQRCIGKLLREAVTEHKKDFDDANIRDFPDLFIQSEFSGEAVDFEAFSLMMTDMFVAGTESTATALGWTLLYLSKYPDIQHRCHKMIDQVIETERLPLLSDRPKLVYIDALMCEVFRHATIAPLALFHCNLNEKGTINGYEVPPGSFISYNIWLLHRDPSYWEEPELFNPDRWIDSDGKLLTHSSHFIPFGLGPRICLGENLARVEFHLFIVALLHRFTFSVSDPDISLNGVVGTTYAPPPYELLVKRR